MHLASPASSVDARGLLRSSVEKENTSKLAAMRLRLRVLGQTCLRDPAPSAARPASALTEAPAPISMSVGSRLRARAQARGASPQAFTMPRRKRAGGVGEATRTFDSETCGGTAKPPSTTTCCARSSTGFDARAPPAPWRVLEGGPGHGRPRRAAAAEEEVDVSAQCPRERSMDAAVARSGSWVESQ